MDGKEFLDCLARIVGRENAIRYAKRITEDLDSPCYGSILGYEALAFYAYSTEMNWHVHINGELWTRRPSVEIATFAKVLNSALEKAPLYVQNDRLVFRGFQTEDLRAFLARYVPGRIIDFPGFTSAAFVEERAFGGNVLFIIRSLTARVIWHVAANYWENEVLIPAGRSFRVLDTQQRPNKAVVYLEEQP